MNKKRFDYQDGAPTPQRELDAPTLRLDEAGKKVAATARRVLPNDHDHVYCSTTLKSGIVRQIATYGTRLKITFLQDGVPVSGYMFRDGDLEVIARAVRIAPTRQHTFLGQLNVTKGAAIDVGVGDGGVWFHRILPDGKFSKTTRIVGDEFEALTRAMSDLMTRLKETTTAA